MKMRSILFAVLASSTLLWVTVAPQDRGPAPQSQHA